MIKITNFKLMKQYQNKKTFLLKDILQIGLKKFLLHGHMLLMISMGKKLLERFMKKDWKKQIKKNLE